MRSRSLEWEKKGIQRYALCLPYHLCTHESANSHSQQAKLRSGWLLHCWSEVLLWRIVQKSDEYEVKARRGKLLEWLESKIELCWNGEVWSVFSLPNLWGENEALAQDVHISSDEVIVIWLVDDLCWTRPINSQWYPERCYSTPFLKSRGRPG